MKPISKFLGLILVFFSFGDLYGQSLGVYQNYTIPQIGGNAIIQPSVLPTGTTKSSVKVSGHFRGEVYIEPTTGKIHVNNAYPNGDYKVDVFAPNGLTTNFTLTVAGSDCKFKGRFLFSSELLNIPSKSSRVVDINRDGMSDLVLLRQDIGGLTVMLNTSNGFQKNVDLILGYVPESFDVGDLNNDGLIDIAATNSVDQTVVIFYGLQNFSFQNPVSIKPIAVITRPQSNIIDGTFLVETPKKLFIQDLNNDGFTDILIFSSLQGIVFIGMGKGDNTFDFNQSVKIQDTNEFGDIEIADFTNDGISDIILNIGRPGTVASIGMLAGKFQLISSGSGSIGSGISGTPKFEIFDINGDGNLDIYYTDGVNGATLSIGTGGGAFLPPDQFSFGTNNTGLYLKILDLNGDQFLDYFQFNTPNIQTFGSVIGNGFITESDYFDPIPGTEFSDVQILDINGDNLLDVCISDISGTTSILLGTQEYFVEKKNSSFVTNVGQIAGIQNEDLNDDGINDFIFGDRMNNSIHVFKGNSVGGFDYFNQFSLNNVPNLAQLSSIQKADLNNDKITDILAAVGDRVYIYQGIGQGSFKSNNVIGQLDFLQFNQNVLKIYLLDYNKDGLNDLITITSDSIYVNFNKNDFAFYSSISSGLNASLSNINGLEVKDINHDSFTDIVISDATIETILVFVGDKNGEFLLNKKYLVPGLQGFTLSDYNQDGIEDLVIAEQQVGIILYLGDSQLNFYRNKILYNTEPYVYNYVFSGKDLNGDQINDFLFFDFSGSIKILFYNIRGSQVSEQITTSKAPLFWEMEKIFASDVISPFNVYFDGNIDLFYINVLDGNWIFLVNESLEKNIIYNGGLASKIILCQPENVLLETNYQLNNTLQWEYSTDNLTYYPIERVNYSRFIYSPSPETSYIRVKSTEDPLCPSGSNSLTKPIEFKKSRLYTINILDSIYSICDTSLLINLPSIYKNYLWSTGDSLNYIQLNNSGKVLIKVTDSLFCTKNDTAIVEMNAINIVQNDTLSCASNPISLYIDSIKLKNSLYLNDFKSGLIFYAPMDSSTYDHTANFINRKESGISYGKDRYGSPNKAVIFKALDSNNIVYDYTNILEQRAYTVSGWVKVISGTFWLRTPLIGFLGSTSYAESYAELGIDAPGVISPDTWHHIVTIWDTITLQHFLYVDGKKIESGSGTSPIWLNPPDVSSIFVGSHVSDATLRDFLGSIDDVAIWNRVLSSDEIFQLYSDKLNVVWSNGSIGNSITVNPLNTTKYFATVTNGNTVCYDSVLVRINSIDTALQISSPLPKCFLDTVTITASKGFTYQWFKNDNLLVSSTSNIFSTPDSGIYKVLIRDVNGCLDSSSTINVRNITIASSFSVNDTTQLLTGNSFVFSNGSSVGVGGFSHLWDFGDGATSTDFSPVHVYDSVGVYRVKLMSTSDQGCSDSSYVDISVISDMNAAFFVNDSVQCLMGNHFEFRDTSIVKSSNVTYHWDFGDGSTSNIQHPTHIYQQPGFYEVKLKIIELFGGIDSSIIRIRVDSMPVVDFSVNDTLQCLVGNSFNFLNRSIESNGGIYSYLWKFGDGDSSLLTSPSHIYKSSGTFNIFLLGKDINGCFDSSSINVNVFSSPSVSFTVNDTIQTFASNRFIFNNLSDTTSSSVYRYSWYFGDGSNSSDFSPIHMYDSVGEYRVKLKVVSDIGCSDSTSMDVKIFSVLKVDFAVNDTVQCLVGNFFEFRDSSFVDGGSMTYRWEFGDGNIAFVKNPTYIYSLPGEYNVKLVVKGTFGGLDSSIVRVRVASSPVVAFIVNDSLQCLSVNRFIFSNISVSTAGESNSYKWYFGDGDSSNLSSTTHVYRLSGNYAIRLIGTNINGCSDTTGLNVHVLNPPIAEFTVNDSVQCLSGNRFVLKNSTIRNGNGLQYSWDFGDGNISREESPVHIYEKSGSFVINLISVNSSGCSDTVDFNVQVFPKPISKFNLNDSLQCITTNIFRFTDSTKVPVGEKYTLQWNFGDGTGSFFQNPIHTYKLPGSYFVKLISSVSEGCTDSSSVKVTIAEPPPFLKYEPVDVVSGISTKLQARQIGVKYQWSPSTGLSSPSIFDPFVFLKNEQRYVIKITTDAKCDVYDSLLVRVFNKYDIFVPQGFTPNNDGKNDRLFPFLVGIKSLTVFKIFDRWGNLVYSNSNVDRNNGWNGTLNGKILPLGVYIWVSEGIDLDNNLIRRTGNVALIR